MLDRLEHARKQIAAREADEVALRDVDESLEELGSLCLAKTLKSRFRDAARRVVRQPDDKRDVRKSFQRAILKAKVAHRLGRNDRSAHGNVDQERADCPGELEWDLRDRHKRAEPHEHDLSEVSHHGRSTQSRSEVTWQPDLNRSSTQPRPHAGDGPQRQSSEDMVPTSASSQRPTIQQTHSLEEHHTKFEVRKLMDPAELAAKKNSVRAMILAAELDISHNRWQVPEASENRHSDSRRPPNANECCPEGVKGHSDSSPTSSTLQILLGTPRSTCDHIRPPEGQSPRSKPAGRPKVSPLAAVLRSSIGLSHARASAFRS